MVALVYGYRRVTETAQTGTLKNIIGLGNPVPLGQWATAWGVTYLILSILASATPPVGGSMAILVMAGDLLTNMGNASGGLAADIAKQQQQPAAVSASTSTSAAAPSRTINPVTGLPHGAAGP